jgi:hypothetical protein
MLSLNITGVLFIPAGALVYLTVAVLLAAIDWVTCPKYLRYKGMLIEWVAWPMNIFKFIK